MASRWARSAAMPCRSMRASSVDVGSSTSLRRSAAPTSRSFPPKASPRSRIARACTISASASAWSSSSVPKASCPSAAAAGASSRPRYSRDSASSAKERRPGLTRYAASAVSMVTPSTVQPCSAKTRIDVLRVVQDLGPPGSASHAANAFSSASSSWVGSNQAAAPPAPASATSVTDPAPSAQVSTVARPRAASPCSASHGASSPAPSTEPSTSTPGSAGVCSASSAPGSTARSRSRSDGLRISRVSRTIATAVRSYAARSRSSTVLGSSTSRTISVSRRFSLTASRWSRRFCPALPLTSSARSTSSANEPNWLIHFAAVFSPTPGMPGRLSDGSPRRAAKSGYWAGVSPYFSSTFSGVNRVSSETPFVG